MVNFGGATVTIHPDFDPLFRGIQAAQGQVRSQLSALGSIGSTAFSVAAGLGLRDLASSVAGVASGFVTANAELSQYRVSLGVMLQDHEKAGRLMKELVNFAASTPFELPGLMKGVQVLRMYGFETEKLLPMLKVIGDAAAASPAGMEQGVYLIGLAMGQIRAAGKLMGQEIRQLVNAGVPVWEILTKQTGKSVNEVREMIKAGAIDGATAIDMLLKGMSERTGGMMQAQSQEFFGLVSTIKDELRQFQMIAGGPLFEKIKTGLRSIVDYMRSAQGQMQFREIAGQMQKLLDVIMAIGASPLFRGAVMTGAFFALGTTITGMLPSLRQFHLLHTHISNVIPGVAAGMRSMTIATIAQTAATLALNLALAAAAAGLGLIVAAFLRSQATGETFGESVLRLTHNLGGLIDGMKTLDSMNADESDVNEMAKKGDTKGLDAAQGKFAGELRALEAKHTRKAYARDENGNWKEITEEIGDAAGIERMRFVRGEVQRIENLKKQMAAGVLGPAKETEVSAESSPEAKIRAAQARSKQKRVAESLISSYDNAMSVSEAKKAARQRKNDMKQADARRKVAVAAARGRRRVRGRRKSDASKTAAMLGDSVKQTLFGQLMGGDLAGAGQTMTNIREAGKRGKAAKDDQFAVSSQGAEQAFRQIQESILTPQKGIEEDTKKIRDATIGAYAQLQQLNSNVRNLAGVARVSADSEV